MYPRLRLGLQGYQVNSEDAVKACKAVVRSFEGDINSFKVTRTSGRLYHPVDIATGNLSSHLSTSTCYLSHS